jgi:hypothetical protein
MAQPTTLVEILERLEFLNERVRSANEEIVALTTAALALATQPAAGFVDLSSSSDDEPPEVRQTNAEALGYIPGAKIMITRDPHNNMSGSLTTRRGADHGPATYWNIQLDVPYNKNNKLVEFIYKRERSFVLIP